LIFFLLFIDVLKIIKHKLVLFLLDLKHKLLLVQIQNRLDILFSNNIIFPPKIYLLVIFDALQHYLVITFHDIFIRQIPNHRSNLLIRTAKELISNLACLFFRKEVINSSLKDPQFLGYFILTFESINHHAMSDIQILNKLFQRFLQFIFISYFFDHCDIDKFVPTGSLTILLTNDTFGFIEFNNTGEHETDFF